jgi:hypothetical protein
VLAVVLGRFLDVILSVLFLDSRSWCSGPGVRVLGVPSQGVPSLGHC